MFCNNLSFDSCSILLLDFGQHVMSYLKGIYFPLSPPVVISAVRWHRLLRVLQKNQKLLLFFYYIFAVPHGSLVLSPHSWMESVPSTVEAHRHNYWTTGSLPQRLLLLRRYIYFLSCLLSHVSSTLHLVCCYFTFRSQESCL